MENKESLTANLAIYKYKNRKLYCKNLKRYVTLQEIFDWVKDGATATILDHESGRDVTKEVLLTCIYRNFLQNTDRFVLKEIEETIQTLDESYSILDKVE